MQLPEQLHSAHVKAAAAPQSQQKRGLFRKQNR